MYQLEEPPRRSKPKGAKCRNLVAYRERIFYDRVVGGRRYWRDLKTTDWDDAIVLRDRLEELDGIEKRRGDVPKFDVFAQRYLNEDTERLAATTLRDRRDYLGERGLFLPHFASKRLDEITPEMLRQWWGKEITGAGRSAGTGRNYINTLAQVYAFAQDLGFVSESPVTEFRRQLNRKGRTKRGRAEARRDKHIRPIESPDELARLVKEAEAEGLVASVMVLLQLDAGLRLGEVLALRWGKIIWGQDEDDRVRGLWIDENLPSGGTGEPEEPKSGRARKVGLSRRLRRALGDLYLERFRDHPGLEPPERRVLEGIHPGNFRARQWRRICGRADLGHRAMKDLRDTYASQLLTCGVQLGYVSLQLGHSKPTITADHYAKWCGGDDYRDPLAPRYGELPADLLARIPAESPSYSRHSGDSTQVGVGLANEEHSEIEELNDASGRTRTGDSRSGATAIA